MVAALEDKLDRGESPVVVCRFSRCGKLVRARRPPASGRIDRHLAYERYIVDELIPPYPLAHLAQQRRCPPAAALAASTLPAWRCDHPRCHQPAMLTMSGAFDLVTPMFAAATMTTTTYFTLPHPTFCPTWATAGSSTACAATPTSSATRSPRPSAGTTTSALPLSCGARGIPVRLGRVGGDGTGHDWPWWENAWPRHTSKAHQEPIHPRCTSHPEWHHTEHAREDRSEDHRHSFRPGKTPFHRRSSNRINGMNLPEHPWRSFVEVGAVQRGCPVRLCRHRRSHLP